MISKYNIDKFKVVIIMVNMFLNFEKNKTKEPMKEGRSRKRRKEEEERSGLHATEVLKKTKKQKKLDTVTVF